jgi:hypothetical protein
MDDEELGLVILKKLSGLFFQIYIKPLLTYKFHLLLLFP